MAYWILHSSSRCDQNERPIMSTGYDKIIIEATGCSASEAEGIEEIMRNLIFHSTLDWQTRLALEQAARLAHALLRQMRQSHQEGM
jgi:hypothetical protein